jgi:hypothetical protein
MAWQFGMSYTAWVGVSSFSQQYIPVGVDTSLSALKSPHLIILVPFNDGLALWCVLSSLGGSQLLLPINTFLLVATPLFLRWDLPT